MGVIILIGIAIIIVKLIKLPRKIKINHYIELFKKINLKTPNEEYPIWIIEEENEFLKVLSFHSRIPISEWNSKKNLIETYLNKKIINIVNAEDNNNIVYVFITKNELPSNILFDDTKDFPLDEEVLNLGISYTGYAIMDLNTTAHAFIAGETGCGKSNILLNMISQSLYKGHEVKLIDFKRGISFAVFEKYIKIYSTHETIKQELEDLVDIMNRRFDMFRAFRVDNLIDYNNRCEMKVNRIVVFIDELAELIKTSDKEITKNIIGNLETLTRLSRAAGINLIMGVQRPDSTVITGQIKNNVSFRVCGRFVDPEPSRIMLGNDTATKLPNIKGRFIVKSDSFQEFQAFRFSGFENSSEEYYNDVALEYEPSLDSETDLISEPTEETPAQPIELEKAKLYDWTKDSDTYISKRAILVEQKQTLSRFQEMIEEFKPINHANNKPTPQNSPTISHTKEKKDIEFNYDDIDL